MITQSRSVIGAGVSAHSSLSNKRQKSPRGISHNSSATIKASNSATKTLSGANGASSTAFSFINSKLRNKHITASTNFQSVHPYTVMAMPLHSSQNNLKETGLLSMSSAATKKGGSNRPSLMGDPSLTKMTKTSFIKSS